MARESYGRAAAGAAPADVFGGTPGDDTYTGTAADDKVDGLSGDDTLSGRAGDDALSGGEGNDILDGGRGDDILDGGAGHDIASYEHATAAVTVDLSLTSAQDTGGAGIDTLSNFEWLTDRRSMIS